MFKVTERAARKAKSIAEGEGTDPILRIGVRGGGCSGLSYFLDFGESRDNDIRQEIEGLMVVCDPKSLKFLEGVELDYDTRILSSGFKFNNPNAKRSCSCGESFAV